MFAAGTTEQQRREGRILYLPRCGLGWEHTLWAAADGSSGEAPVICAPLLPSSPPPERIPGWVIQQLTDNSFGGAFGAIFLWMVLLLMSLGAYRAYQHREKLFESWQRPGAGLRMLEPLPEQPSSSFMPPSAPPQSGATARAD